MTFHYKQTVIFIESIKSILPFRHLWRGGVCILNFSSFFFFWSVKIYLKIEGSYSKWILLPVHLCGIFRRNQAKHKHDVPFPGMVCEGRRCRRGVGGCAMGARSTKPLLPSIWVPGWKPRLCSALGCSQLQNPRPCALCIPTSLAGLLSLPVRLHLPSHRGTSGKVPL